MIINKYGVLEKVTRELPVATLDRLLWKALLQEARSSFYILSNMIISDQEQVVWLWLWKHLLAEGKTELAVVIGEKVKVRKSAGLSFWASHLSAALKVCSLWSSEALTMGCGFPIPGLAAPCLPSQCTGIMTGTYLPD